MTMTETAGKEEGAPVRHKPDFYASENILSNNVISGVVGLYCCVKSSSKPYYIRFIYVIDSLFF